MCNNNIGRDDDAENVGNVSETNTGRSDGI